MADNAVNATENDADVNDKNHEPNDVPMDTEEQVNVDDDLLNDDHNARQAKSKPNSEIVLMKDNINYNLVRKSII